VRNIITKLLSRGGEKNRWNACDTFNWW